MYTCIVIYYLFISVYINGTIYHFATAFGKNLSQRSMSIYITLFIFYLFILLAVLGLRCCTWAFLQLQRAGATLCCGEWVSCGAQALGVPASVAVAHGLSSCGSQALERRLSSCGAQAQLLHSMWDLPGPGLKPVSPALAGGFLTTVPPGKPNIYNFTSSHLLHSVPLYGFHV